MAVKKNEFLEELKKAVSGYPEEETDKFISFYEEMIEDRMEDGMSEEDAVSSLGCIEKIAKEIKEEMPLKAIVMKKAEDTKNKKLPTWAVVLLCCLSPVLFSVSLSLSIVLFVMYLMLWVFVVVLFSIDVSVLVSGVAMFVGSFVNLSKGDLLSFLFYLGLGIAGVAGAVLFVFLCILAAKGVVKLTKLIIRGIKKLLTK